MVSLTLSPEAGLGVGILLIILACFALLSAYYGVRKVWQSLKHYVLQPLAAIAVVVAAIAVVVALCYWMYQYWNSKPSLQQEQHEYFLMLRTKSDLDRIQVEEVLMLEASFCCWFAEAAVLAVFLLSVAIVLHMMCSESKHIRPLRWTVCGMFAVGFYRLLNTPWFNLLGAYCVAGYLASAIVKSLVPFDPVHKYSVANARNLRVVMWMTTLSYVTATDPATAAQAAAPTVLQAASVAAGMVGAAAEMIDAAQAGQADGQPDGQPDAEDEEEATLKEQIKARMDRVNALAKELDRKAGCKWNLNALKDKKSEKNKLHAKRKTELLKKLATKEQVDNPDGRRTWKYVEPEDSTGEQVPEGLKDAQHLSAVAIIKFLSFASQEQIKEQALCQQQQRFDTNHKNDMLLSFTTTTGEVTVLVKLVEGKNLFTPKELVKLEASLRQYLFPESATSMLTEQPLRWAFAFIQPVNPDEEEHTNFMSSAKEIEGKITTPAEERGKLRYHSVGCSRKFVQKVKLDIQTEVFPNPTKFLTKQWATLSVDELLSFGIENTDMGLGKADPDIMRKWFKVAKKHQPKCYGTSGLSINWLTAMFPMLLAQNDVYGPRSFSDLPRSFLTVDKASETSELSQLQTLAVQTAGYQVMQLAILAWTDVENPQMDLHYEMVGRASQPFYIKFCTPVVPICCKTMQQYLRKVNILDADLELVDTGTLRSWLYVYAANEASCWQPCHMCDSTGSNFVLCNNESLSTEKLEELDWNARKHIASNGYQVQPLLPNSESCNALEFLCAWVHSIPEDLKGALEWMDGNKLESVLMAFCWLQCSSEMSKVLKASTAKFKLTGFVEGQVTLTPTQWQELFKEVTKHLPPRDETNQTIRKSKFGIWQKLLKEHGFVAALLLQDIDLQYLIADRLPEDDVSTTANQEPAAPPRDVPLISKKSKKRKANSGAPSAENCKRQKSLEDMNEEFETVIKEKETWLLNFMETLYEDLKQCANLQQAQELVHDKTQPKLAEKRGRRKYMLYFLINAIYYEMSQVSKPFSDTDVDHLLEITTLEDVIEFFCYVHDIPEETTEQPAIDSKATEKNVDTILDTFFNTGKQLLTNLTSPFQDEFSKQWYDTMFNFIQKAAKVLDAGKQTCDYRHLYDVLHYWLSDLRKLQIKLPAKFALSRSNNKFADVVKLVGWLYDVNLKAIREDVKEDWGKTVAKKSTKLYQTIQGKNAKPNQDFEALTKVYIQDILCPKLKEILETNSDALVDSTDVQAQLTMFQDHVVSYYELKRDPTVSEQDYKHLVDNLCSTILLAGILQLENADSLVNELFPLQKGQLVSVAHCFEHLFLWMQTLPSETSYAELQKQLNDARVALECSEDTRRQLEKQIQQAQTSAAPSPPATPAVPVDDSLPGTAPFSRHDNNPSDNNQPSVSQLQEQMTQLQNQLDERKEALELSEQHTGHVKTEFVKSLVDSVNTMFDTAKSIGPSYSPTAVNEFEHDNDRMTVAEIAVSDGAFTLTLQGFNTDKQTLQVSYSDVPEHILKWLQRYQAEMLVHLMNRLQNAQSFEEDARQAVVLTARLEASLAQIAELESNLEKLQAEVASPKEPSRRQRRRVHQTDETGTEPFPPTDGNSQVDRFAGASNTETQPVGTASQLPEVAAGGEADANNKTGTENTELPQEEGTLSDNHVRLAELSPALQVFLRWMQDSGTYWPQVKWVEKDGKWIVATSGRGMACRCRIVLEDTGVEFEDVDDKNKCLVPFAKLQNIGNGKAGFLSVVNILRAEMEKKANATEVTEGSWQQTALREGVKLPTWKDVQLIGSKKKQSDEAEAEETQPLPVTKKKRKKK